MKAENNPLPVLKLEENWKGHSDLQEVYPRVFLTNAFGARNLRKLEEKNITHILVNITFCWVYL